MTNFAPTLTKPIELLALSPADARWVEERLAVGGYLEPDQVNGVIGKSTQSAFAKFKADLYLDSPQMIGGASIDALAKLENAHPISEQANFNQKPDPAAGTKSGRMIRLPKLGDRHLNEWIAPGSFLSFAEFTHGGTRIPETEAQIHNMLQLAERFGWIRRKFDSAIGVTSAFRPERINRAVGGARNSWHVRAAALDIYPINGNMAALTEVIKASDAGGIGIADSFRHIDLGNRRFWRYGR